MPELIALDPGEKHCGVAVWDSTHDDPATFTCPPPTLHAALEHWFGTRRWLPSVVMEEFRLYPWKMDQQGFSQLKTVEVIGVVRYLCTRFGAPLIEQSATIKKPTFAQLKARGIDLHGKNQHERDAEAHGWHRLLTTEGDNNG